MSIIDKHLQERQENRRLRPPETLYVTDLTHPCRRQRYYNITETRPHNIQTLRIFEAGKLLEKYWINILDKQKNIKVITTQIPAYHTITVEDTNWKLRGRADALIQHDKTHLVLHEVKTTKTTYYHRLEDAPKLDHELQLQFYLNILCIDHGQIDYLDKQALLQGTTSIDLSFPIQRNPATIKKILIEAQDIALLLQNNILPEGNSEAWNGKICEYCNYNDLCEEGGKP